MNASATVTFDSYDPSLPFSFNITDNPKDTFSFVLETSEPFEATGTALLDLVASLRLELGGIPVDFAVVLPVSVDVTEARITPAVGTPIVEGPFAGASRDILGVVDSIRSAAAKIDLATLLAVVNASSNLLGVDATRTTGVPSLGQLEGAVGILKGFSVEAGIETKGFVSGINLDQGLGLSFEASFTVVGDISVNLETTLPSAPGNSTCIPVNGLSVSGEIVLPSPLRGPLKYTAETSIAVVFDFAPELAGKTVSVVYAGSFVTRVGLSMVNGTIIPILSTPVLSGGGSPTIVLDAPPDQAKALSLNIAVTPVVTLYKAAKSPLSRTEERANSVMPAMSSWAETKRDSILEEDTTFADAVDRVYAPASTRGDLGLFKYVAGPSDHELAIYEDVGAKTILCAVRGSVTAEDWGVTDVALLLGTLHSSARYLRNAAAVRSLMALYPENAFIMSGHSLGGTLAIQITKDLNSTRVRAVSFNAGHSPLDPVEK